MPFPPPFSRSYILAVLILFGKVSLWGAPTINLQVDFSDYTLGPISGQSRGIMGPEGWSGLETAEVVPTPDSISGPASQALAFYRLSGIEGINAPLATKLTLSEVGLTYLAFDLYKPEDRGGGHICLSQTTASFGVSLSSHSGATLLVNKEFVPGEGVNTHDTDYVIETQRWYRIEMEITQTGPGNTGCFDLFVTPEGEFRKKIASEVAYSFQNAQQVRFSASSPGFGSDRKLLVANILLQSGLSDFPETASPSDPVTGADPFPGAVNVGHKRQLFIDRKFVEELDNVNLKGHAAQKAGLVVLRADQPWEKGGFAFAFQVLHPPQGKWQMWYEARSLIARKWEETDNKVHYAESDDGIHWRKPSLGLMTVNGSSANNAVYAGASGKVGHGVGVLIDPSAPDEERYKMVLGDFAQPGAPLYGAYSRDGLHWTTYPNGPIIKQGADTQTAAFFDPKRKTYVMYVRRNVRPDGEKFNPEGIRRVGRSESPDFQKFPPSVDVMKAAPSDPSFTGLYNSAASIYSGAEDVYVAFPSLFPDEKHEGGSLMEPFLAVSRNGIDWERPSKHPFLRLGQEGLPGDPLFTSRQIYISPGTFLVGDELFIYYAAFAIHHGQAGPHLAMPVAYFLATLRRDGFVSVRADQKEGRFTSPPLIFDGNCLEMNLSLQSEGEIRVGLQTATEQDIPGFTTDDMDALWGDHPSALISWRGKTDLSHLAGTAVRIHVQMRQGDLYAFQFVRPSAADIANRLASQAKLRAKGSALTAPDPGAEMLKK